MKTTKLWKYMLPLMTVLMSVSMGASAQGYLQVTTMHLKPFTESMLVDAISIVNQGLDEAESSYGWLASRSMSGDERVMIAVPHESMGDLEDDPFAVLSTVFGPDEGQQMLNNLQSSVSAIHTERYVMRPDLSREPPDMGVPAAAITISLEIANGRNAEFEDWVGTVIEATEATEPEARWLMMSPAFGTNNYLVVALVEDWGDMDTPMKSVPQRIIEHFGERLGAQMVEGSNSIVVGITTDLWRPRPDDLGRPMPE